MPKTLIQLKKINKSFGSNHVVKDLSIDIMDGEFLTLLGPSGCGKTTILRMISGFEIPDDGEITLLGENLLQIPANKREVNTVFQNYALFPHLTVKENIGFSMRMKKVTTDEVETRVNDMLKLAKLESFAFRKPGQLSGGQQQRVAVARSLVNRPKVVLLDEPLGALDLQLRKQMQIELKRLQRKLRMTYVYVTHDQEEAMIMSDRIIVMNGGKIEQIGTPEEVYNTPKTTFVAKFLGESNIFEGTFKKNGDGYFFATEGIKIPVQEQNKDSGLAALRPEFFNLHRRRPDTLCFEGIVRETAYLGNINRISVELPSGKIIYVLSTNDDFPEGMNVFVSFDKNRLSFIQKSN